MVRVIIFLLSIGLLAAVAVWFAYWPRGVAFTWQGYRIETSATVLVVAASALAALVVLVWSIVRAIGKSLR
jgi:uncharacterized membrane-anchored protein